MNNPSQLSAKNTKEKKRLADALKRNIVRRKQQSDQRKQVEAHLIQEKRGTNDTI
jgi:hypothetical protein